MVKLAMECYDTVNNQTVKASNKEKWGVRVNYIRVCY